MFYSVWIVIERSRSIALGWSIRPPRRHQQIINTRAVLYNRWRVQRVHLHTINIIKKTKWPSWWLHKMNIMVEYYCHVEKIKIKTCWPGGGSNGTRTKEWHSPNKKKKKESKKISFRSPCRHHKPNPWRRSTPPPGRWAFFVICARGRSVRLPPPPKTYYGRDAYSDKHHNNLNIYGNRGSEIILLIRLISTLNQIQSPTQKSSVFFFVLLQGPATGRKVSHSS